MWYPRSSVFRYQIQSMFIRITQHVSRSTDVWRKFGEIDILVTEAVLSCRCCTSMLRWECLRPACTVDFDEFETRVCSECARTCAGEGRLSWLTSAQCRIFKKPQKGWSHVACMCCICSVSGNVYLCVLCDSIDIVPITLSLEGIPYNMGSAGMLASANAK